MQFKLLLIFLFCSTAAFAQIQSQKGSITLKDGAVVNGAVTYYYDNPSEIALYAENGAKTTYSPVEILQIILANGEKFVTKTYAINQDSSTVMLQSLIESSRISLFTREDNANVYYYVSKNNHLYRLEKNYVVTHEGAKTYRRNDNKYIATLSTLMADRFDLLERLNKVSLTEGDLTKIIVDYNKGDVSYYWKSNITTTKEPNWMLFVQHSRYGTFLDEELSDYSSGQLIGLQYYFSKHSRHSIKFSLEKSYYVSGDDRFDVTGLGIRYQYGFKQAEKYGLYLLLQAADVAYIKTTNERRKIEYSGLSFYPRLSPGLGFEVKPLSKFAMYAEVNHLLRLSAIPHSFSLGLKYDFGKTSL